MSIPIPVVDHVVIYVADQLDDASDIYRRLGFQLSERGHHTLGSSNHLAIFGENYLELLGYEPAKSDAFKGQWQSPKGLSGLAWKTQSADGDFQHLQAEGLGSEPPKSFHRPVRLPDGQQTEARFRTVGLATSEALNGRNFFCQHETPHAVWQSEWQDHPNGVQHISEFVIVAEDPAATARIYSQLFGTALQAGEHGDFTLPAGKASLHIVPGDYAQARFGSLPEDYDGTARFAALSLRTDALDKVKTSLQAGDIPFREQQDGILVDPGNAFNLAVRFHS